MRLLGTAGNENGTGIRVDSSGNAYVTGFTNGNLDSQSNAGSNDAFIAKYNSSGTKQWVRLLGTAGNEQSYGIAIDSSGNSYITGVTNGDPGTSGSPANAGGNDIFIAKYNSSGTQQWVQLLGAAGDELGQGIAVDSSGNVYVSGFTDGSIGTSGSPANAGINDVFIAKYNSSGAKQWVRLLGAAGNDIGSAIAVDSSGNAYLTGFTDGSIGTSGSPANAGADDIFIAKYDSSGNQTWVRLLGTTSSELGLGIAVDSSGNSYVTGDTPGNLGTSGSPANAGGTDIVIAKYNSSGTKQWVQLLGTAGDEQGNGIAVDSSGNSYVTGLTGGNLNGETNAGNDDIFIAKYNSSGTKQSVTLLGNSVTNQGYGIAFDSGGNASYVTGLSEGDLGGQTSAGNQEVVIWKKEFATPTETPTNTPTNTPTPITMVEWISQTSGTTNALRDVGFGNNTFVAVGASGTILTSTNGSTWTSRTSGTTSDQYGVGFGNNTFVSVGGSGTILTSTDGTTWTSRTSGTTNALFGVGFGNNTFVAVGASGKILISTNGSTWTSRTSGTSNILRGVTFGNSLFVTVGDSGTILTSTDGITWAPRTSGTTNILYDVVFGNNTFVAVGNSGTILTSPDGITWTSRTAGTSLGLYSVVFGNNTFVAVGNSGTILTSPDGITWTSRTSGIMNSLFGVGFGNNTFVAVGTIGTILTGTITNSLTPTRTPTPTIDTCINKDII